MVCYSKAMETLMHDNHACAWVILAFRMLLSEGRRVRGRPLALRCEMIFFFFAAL